VSAIRSVSQQQDTEGGSLWKPHMLAVPKGFSSFGCALLTLALNFGTGHSRIILEGPSITVACLCQYTVWIASMLLVF
jgi:hypothetical protein